MDELIRQIQEELLVNPINDEEWDKSKYTFKLLNSLRIVRKETLVYLQLIQIYEVEEDADVIAFGIFLTSKQHEKEPKGLEIIFRHKEDAETFFKVVARCIDIHVIKGGFGVEPLTDNSGD